MLPSLVILLLLGVLYAAEVRLVAAVPTAYLRLAVIPWGRARRVPIHPRRLEKLQSGATAVDYRHAARKTAIGRRLRAIRDVTADPRDGSANPSVLQPAPDAAALLVVTQPVLTPNDHVLFVARVADDGGVAEVRAFAVPRLVPLLTVCAVIVLLVQTGRVPPVALICFVGILASTGRVLARVSTKVQWAHEVIAARLASPPASSRPKRERRSQPPSKPAIAQAG